MGLIQIVEDAAEASTSRGTDDMRNVKWSVIM